MATKDLQSLRHSYKAAYTAYMSCVQALSDASQRGEWPSEDILRNEQKALDDLTLARRSLLDGLYTHTHKKTGS